MPESLANAESVPSENPVGCHEEGDSKPDGNGTGGAEQRRSECAYDADQDAIDPGHHAWGAGEDVQATTVPVQTRVGVDAGLVIVNRKGLDVLDLRQELDVPLAHPIDADDQ